MQGKWRTRAYRTHLHASYGLLPKRRLLYWNFMEKYKSLFMSLIMFFSLVFFDIFLLNKNLEVSNTGVLDNLFKIIMDKSIYGWIFVGFELILASFGICLNERNNISSNGNNKWLLVVSGSLILFLLIAIISIFYIIFFKIIPLSYTCKIIHYSVSGFLVVLLYEIFVIFSEFMLKFFKNRLSAPKNRLSVLLNIVFAFAILSSILLFVIYLFFSLNNGDFIPSEVRSESKIMPLYVLYSGFVTSEVIGLVKPCVKSFLGLSENKS